MRRCARNTVPQHAERLPAQPFPRGRTCDDTSADDRLDRRFDHQRRVERCRDRAKFVRDFFFFCFFVCFFLFRFVGFFFFCFFFFIVIFVFFFFFFFCFLFVFFALYFCFFFDVMIFLFFFFGFSVCFFFSFPRRAIRGIRSAGPARGRWISRPSPLRAERSCGDEPRFERGQARREDLRRRERDIDHDRISSVGAGSSVCAKQALSRLPDEMPVAAPSSR